MNTLLKTTIAACSLLLTVGAVAQNSRVNIATENQTRHNHLGVNVYYLAHHIVNDVFYGTGLAAGTTNEEKMEVVRGVMYSLDAKHPVSVSIKQDEGTEIHLFFEVKKHPKHGQTITMRMNFDEEGGALTTSLQQEPSMFRWYKLWDGKLTASTNFFDPMHAIDATKPVEEIASMLHDDYAGNDARAFSMTDQLKGDPEQEMYAMVYKASIAMMRNDAERAEDTIKALDKHLQRHAKELKAHVNLGKSLQAELFCFKKLKDS